MSIETYQGGCQCGAVAYEAEADLDMTVSCNCSRCKPLAAILTFVPQSSFRLISDGPVTEYLFNRQIVRHLFCPTCGIESYALAKGPDGFDMVALNVNCLNGVDPRALNSRHIDGARA